MFVDYSVELMENTKEKIIQATIRVVAGNGLEGAATAKIAKEAQVAVGTLFHHFSNKEILLQAAYDFVMDHYVWHQMGFFDYPDKQARKQLRKAISGSVDYWVRNRNYTSFVRQVTNSNYYQDGMQRNLQRKLDKHFGHLFRISIEKKLLRNYDYPILVDLIFRSIFQAALVILDATKEDKERCRIQCLEFIWAAIGATK